MTEQEILKAKLTIFLKKYGVYGAYITGLAVQGHNGKTIDEIVEWVYRDWETDRKSTRLNSSHSAKSRMPSSA